MSKQASHWLSDLLQVTEYETSQRGFGPKAPACGPLSLGKHEAIGQTVLFLDLQSSDEDKGPLNPCGNGVLCFSGDFRGSQG